LCTTECEGALVKVSSTVANSDIVIPVIPLPSPAKLPLMVLPLTYKDPVITADPLKGNPAPDPPPAFKA